MEKGKIIHVINTIVFFILVVFFSFLTVALAIGSIRAPETNSLLSLTALIPLLFYLLMCSLYFKAFKSINLNNTYLKVSFILNLILLLIISFVFLIIVIFPSKIISSFLGLEQDLALMAMRYLILLISWIIFIISMIFFW